MNIIKEFEGCHLKAYLCPAKVWTIGYGSTIHPNGIKVKKGDEITQEQAERYLQIEIERRSAAMGLPAHMKPNQVEALVSFAYNLGLGAWNRSTLRKKVLLNPSDPTIRNEFMRWVNKGSKFEKGLTRRRKAEADLYFTK
jgi:lysozyme